ncbi:hypothetical protein [Labrys sp. (in: a-proteobacteria)]|uniref:hypothetical protein n=1 Tax=Labrys sp. (in: a-proteobacteria) TaxID=1917972 RepID=UPI0039E4408A
MVSKAEKVQASKNGALDRILAAFESAYDARAPLEIQKLNLELAIVTAANMVLSRAAELDAGLNGMIPADLDVNWKSDDYNQLAEFQKESYNWSSQI